MQRRHYLASTGLVLSSIIAGCSSDEEPIEDEGSADTPTDEPAAGGNGNGGGDDSTPTDEQEDTPSPTSEGSPDIAITGHDLTIDDSGYSTEAFVSATVENQGDGPSGQIELNVQWYDDGGNYLDDSSNRLISLDAGETWSARVHYLGTGAEDVADYEVEGTFNETPPSASSELQLMDSEMSLADSSVDVTGRVENGYDTELSYIEAYAKIYNDAGEVMGQDWTNESDIPAGETWRFRLSWRGRNRVKDAADHSVVLNE